MLAPEEVRSHIEDLAESSSKTAWGFIKKWLILPIGILLQLLGYVETAHKFGLPEPLLFSTAGFLLVAVSLIWLAWFAVDIGQATRRAAVVGLAVCSLAYYSFLQYQLLERTKQQVFEATLDFDSANSLLSRDANEVLQRIKRVAERMPDIADIHNLQGRALFKLARYAAAYEEFKKAAALDSTIAYYQYNQATALRALCDYQGSLAILDAYIKQYKTDMWGFYDHGVVSQIIGQDDNALNDYNIVINSHDVDAPVGSALFNSAVIRASRAAKSPDGDQRNSELNAAFSLLDRAIQLDRTTRLQIIREDLVPITQRAPKCNGYYVTDDLTPVGTLPAFKAWLKKHER
jgi:tetratricopeptide (TPR) repeat protein